MTYDEQVANAARQASNTWKPAPPGPYKSDVLNAKLAEAKAWLKNRKEL